MPTQSTPRHLLLHPPHAYRISSCWYVRSIPANQDSCITDHRTSGEQKIGIGKKRGWRPFSLTALPTVHGTRCRGGIGRSFSVMGSRVHSPPPPQPAGFSHRDGGRRRRRKRNGWEGVCGGGKEEERERRCPPPPPPSLPPSDARNVFWKRGRRRRQSLFFAHEPIWKRAPGEFDRALAMMEKSPPPLWYVCAVL